MPLDTLENTLTHELSDLLSAENQFAKALQTVAKNADSAEVKLMAEQHREETLQQAANLKRAFEILGSKPEKGLVCKAAQGLVEETSSTLKEEKPKGTIKDVILIGGSLRIEHYEIAGYTSAIALAKSLGKKEVVQILQTNLKQEQETAKKLQAAAPVLLQKAQNGGAPATVVTKAPAAKAAAKAPTKKTPAKPAAKATKKATPRKK